MIRDNFKNFYDISQFDLNVSLIEPQIPPNTGNIARLCACSGVSLSLVGTLGFSIDDRYLRRAGLDYWDDVFVKHYNDFAEYSTIIDPSKMIFATTSADTFYWDIHYEPGQHIVFGSETSGIPARILQKYPKQCVTIPMCKGLRSINLSTSVGIILYEAVRQLVQKRNQNDKILL